MFHYLAEVTEVTSTGHTYTTTMDTFAEGPLDAASSIRTRYMYENGAPIGNLIIQFTSAERVDTTHAPYDALTTINL